MLGDPELKKCKVGDIIQLQRRGFFRVDSAYAPATTHSSIESPVILFAIPDGHQKEVQSTGAPVKKTFPNVVSVTMFASQIPKPDLRLRIALCYSDPPLYLHS